MEQRDAWGERLPRHLGLWSAVAVLVGSTIGSGIFRVPAGVAATLGQPGPVLLAWVMGGAIALRACHDGGREKPVQPPEHGGYCSEPWCGHT